MNSTILRFEDDEVRMIDKDGEPWWAAKDVCDVLGIRDHQQAVYGNSKRPGSGLDEDERGNFNVPTPSGMQEMVVINESGLYSLILKSKKPEARRFKRWITHEVLPSLRKRGIYMTPEANESHLFAGAMEFVEQFRKMESRLARMEEAQVEASHLSIELPEPLGVLPDLTNSNHINRAARLYCQITGCKQSAVFALVYAEFEFRCGIRVTARKKKAYWRGTTLSFAIHQGWGDLIYGILHGMIQRSLTMPRAS